MLYVGIIGGGNISQTHARAAAQVEGVRVAAVVGSNSAKVAELAAEHGAQAYAELDRFLQHRPMHLVLIGSPSGVHAEQGVAAARQGLHVLVEKPIDITVERADRLIQACEKAGVRLGVFFQDRVADDILMLRQAIQAGELGRLILASARVKWYRPPEYYSESRWRGTWTLDGGGALMNQGIHTVDLLVSLLGDVSRVYGRARTALHKIETEDTLAAVVEFVSGAVATLEATTSAFPGFPRRLEVTGTEGTVILEHDRVVFCQLQSGRELRPSEAVGEANPSDHSPVVSNVEGHRRLIQNFVLAIQGKEDLLCGGSEGRRSVELVEAIYRSSREGRPIDL